MEAQRLPWLNLTMALPWHDQQTQAACLAGGQREREAEDSGINKMQRRAVPCGSVLGPKHWPKIVEGS